MSDLTIDIFDAIGKGWFNEGITAKSVNEQLLTSPDAEEITVRVNSPGGDVFEGNAIYSLLRAHGAAITTEIHGIAASMGSIIALAGDEVHAAENSMFMIHDPWGFAMGNAAKMRKRADMLEKTEGTLVKIYDRKSNLDRKQIVDMMHAETWMDADEMLSNGFATSIVPLFDSEADTTEDAAARIFASLTEFRRTPNRVLELYSTPAGQVLVAARTNKKEPPKVDERMDKDKLLALLDLAADASDEDIRARIEELKTPPSLDDMVPRADLDAARETITSLRAVNKERFVTDATAAVDQAIADGKFPPASKSFYLAGALSGPDGLENFQKFAGQSPVVIDNDQIKRVESGRSVPLGAPFYGLTEDQRRMADTMGCSYEEYAGTDVSTSESIYGTGATGPAVQ
jgi:ATP-dependent Clp protease protease subunit